MPRISRDDVLQLRVCVKGRGVKCSWCGGKREGQGEGKGPVSGWY